MQRLGRAAAAVLQLQRHLTTEALQRAQWGAARLEGAACSVAWTSSCSSWRAPTQQAHTLHTQAPSRWPLQHGGQAGGTALLPQQQQQQQQLSSATAASPSHAASSSHKSPLLMDEAYQPRALEQQQHSSEAAAAAGRAQSVAPPPPKRIEGVCHRRNVQCGWKKIDFVLRSIRRATVDDAMAQLSANPTQAAVFVKHALANARGNAICAGGEPARLWVAEAFVTKGGRTERRRHFHGRGYSSVRKTRFSHLNVRVEAADDAFLAAAAVRRPPRLLAPIMARMAERRRPPRRALAFGGGRGGGDRPASSGHGSQHQAAVAA